ncbi:hypothetical protein C4580_05470 [Candidatus Woesearchaeota archaeon]|nr:MAG: hypothetical protein C4580_05470 [Candidatus Woesearchaeota archaeon]
MKDTIIVVVAHNSDHVIAAGGTIAKKAKFGHKVITIICSYGVKSQPHLREDVVIKQRERETHKASQLLGIKDVIHLEQARYQDKTILKNIVDIVKREKPTMVLTHPQSLRPDHRAVNHLVVDMIRNKVLSCPVYTFHSRGITGIRKPRPLLVINTTKHFPTKAQALLTHKSRKLFTSLYLWKIILTDRYTGFLHRYKYAEVFDRIF